MRNDGIRKTVTEHNLKPKPGSINSYMLICFDTEIFVILSNYLTLCFGFSDYNTVASQGHSKM